MHWQVRSKTFLPLCFYLYRGNIQEEGHGEVWKNNPLYVEIEKENVEAALEDLMPEVSDEPEKPAQFVPLYDSIKDDDDCSQFEELESHDDTVYLLEANPQ